MSDVTRILSAIEQGDARASEQLLPLVYEELRRLATAKLAPAGLLFYGYPFVSIGGAVRPLDHLKAAGKDLLGILDAAADHLAEIAVAEAFVPRVENAIEDFFTNYKESYGYYDLYLFNPDGYLFYSVERESDYQTNM